MQLNLVERLPDNVGHCLRDLLWRGGFHEDLGVKTPHYILSFGNSFALLRAWIQRHLLSVNSRKVYLNLIHFYINYII